MPRIWTDYLSFLTTQQSLITRTRRAFDRALISLPITQHDRIWVLYLTFINQPAIPTETAVRVYRRYLLLEPHHAEEYIAYLKIKERWGEAAVWMANVVNDDGFRSLEGKSRHQLWLELCDLITKHPSEVSSSSFSSGRTGSTTNNTISTAGIKVEAMLRAGIQKYTDEVGRLWTSLADYYIRNGMFEKARDIYEEGMVSVITVRDFSLIYDALTYFEESLISAKMEQQAGSEDEEGGNRDEDKDDARNFLLVDQGDDLDLRLARLENLMERRPELLSSVILRQNPHNVHEWHKRAKLYASDPVKQIMCYTEAIKTVDPGRAVGKPHGLWCAFAKLYEKNGDLEAARVVFEKATNASQQSRLKYLDDLAQVWTEWSEMELRHKNYGKALELLRRATRRPPRPRSREEEAGMPLEARLYRSLKLWQSRIDLEESLGTFKSTKEAYEAAIDLKVATVQMVLNFTSYLQEKKYFEESFRAYERGVHAFSYPHVKDLWTAYLAQFVSRYGGTKVERTRDLFQEACTTAPPQEAKPFYLQYAKYEEAHGLSRNAMAIYEQGIKKVDPKQKLSLYEVYLARASELFGIGKVREVYESAFEDEDLPASDLRTLMLRYSALEQRLGEHDRARAILAQTSDLADPKAAESAGFWSEWNAFEVKYGNEESFREMLRIKRSVAAKYANTHFNAVIIDASVVSIPEQAVGGGIGEKRKYEDVMTALEEEQIQAPIDVPPAIAQGTRVPGFVSAGVIQQGKTEDGDKEEGAKGKEAAVNPEDIDLGDFEDDDEDEDGGDGGGEDDEGVETKAVPDAVFNGLGERYKKQKKQMNE